MRESIPSVCMMCTANCGILGYLEYGKVVRIGGNPLDPNSRGKICARGIAGVNHLYNPDRILTPLKRVGKRGEGRWKPIPWEEAFKEVVLRLQSLRGEKRENDLVIRNTWDMASNEIAERFASAFGSSNSFHHAILISPNGIHALQDVTGYPMGIEDVAHSRYILNFGGNPYESHFLYVPFIQRLIDGRINLGAKLVTFDVRMSQTAGKSDEWFPILPGTDGMVALSMAHVIANEGLWDRGFIEKRTDLSPSKLLKHLSPFTPKKAEEISGVGASHIRRIAIEFATTRPGIALAGGGTLKHVNGTYNKKSVLLLNALAGNLEKKGGYLFPQRFLLNPPDPIPPRARRMNSESQDLFLKADRGGQRPGVLISHMDNPVYRGPQSKLISTFLQDESRVPFHVAIDPFLNESNMYADLLLPEATYLERWDLLSPLPIEGAPFVSLRQPILKPLGQALSFSNILIELAHRVAGGMEKYFKFGKGEHYVEAMVKRIPGLMDAGGIDFLMEKGIWVAPGPKTAHPSNGQRKVPTPSGRYEFGSSLPTYQPIPHHQRLKEDEFHLTTFQWNVHTQSLTANCKWLMEIVHRNPLLINQETARKLKLKETDQVRLTTSQGSLVTPIFITQGIHPRVVALSDSLGRWNYGRVARGKPFRSEDPETDLLWWGKHGTGNHPNPIMLLQKDPFGEGQGWMDTVVKVEKV
jgi:anaerobic selenocysteine-containing dehydrogenase